MSVFVRIEGLDPEDLTDAQAHDLADRLFADIDEDYPALYEDLTGVIPVLADDEHARLVEVSNIERPTAADEAVDATGVSFGPLDRDDMEHVGDANDLDSTEYDWVDACGYAYVRIDEDDEEVATDGGTSTSETGHGADDVLGTDEVEAFVEELYLAGYRNHHELDDVDPGYEYAIQQLCSEMSGPQVPALTKDVETRAMQRAQERFDEQVRRKDQLTRLDCPSCEDAVDARYLGTATTDEHDGHIVGWECTECGAELQEHVDQRGSSFDLRVVGDQSSTGAEQEESA